MKKNFAFIKTILVLILLISCSKQPSLPTSKAVFRMSICREPSTLDPRKSGELVGSTLDFMLFEGLTRLNQNGSLSFAQAENVEISSDKTVYTFHLKETYWSNGERVTSYDFQNAWRKVLSPKTPSPSAYLFYPIKNAELIKRGSLQVEQLGVRCPDRRTLVVELKSPTPYFLELVSFCTFFPVSSHVDEKHPKWAYESGPHFVTNGPFVLSKWKHGNEMILEKNSFYWDRESIYLDSIHISIITNEYTARRLFENGQLDILGLGVSPMSSEDAARYLEKGKLKIHSSSTTSIICFNTNQFPLNNKKIRKALSYAVNRKEIVDNIIPAGGEVATSLIPPTLTLSEGLSFFKDHDLLLAKQLFREGLKEVGLKVEQFPILFYEYSPSDTNHKLAQVIQNQWRNVFNIRVNLQTVENKILIDNLTKKRFDIVQTFWSAQYSDPVSILERFKSKNNVKNYPGWANDHYSDLLDKSAYASSVQTRSCILTEAEALFFEDMPLAPIYHWKTPFVMSPHFSLDDLSPKGSFDYCRIRPVKLERKESR